MAESRSSEAVPFFLSSQQQILPGKLASVFEEDFTIDPLFHKKLRKAKNKASKGKQKFTMTMPMPTSMPMLRFPNGHFPHIFSLFF